MIDGGRYFFGQFLNFFEEGYVIFNDSVKIEVVHPWLSR